jgi:AAA15 family ATPase/GTPase
VTTISKNGSLAMKIKNLSIQNFRGFRHFDMNDLGRVNLIVGTNNCGKTTALEAVNILMANGDISAIWSTLVRRGEEIWIELGRHLSGFHFSG